MIEEQVLPANPDLFSWCAERTGLHTHDENNNDPAQKMDRALEEKIQHALWQNDVLRATDLNEIDIRVKNGMVHLRGHLLSSINYQRVEKALQTVAGIQGVRNNFVMDDDLVREVAASFVQLEQTYHCKFFTGVSHGVVVLNGEVNSTNVRMSAELCAASNPRVRGVINYIRVPGVALALEDHRLLQPPIGKEVCFLDGVSGIVKQVVINPDNRRVVAMTIQGRFFNVWQNLSTPPVGTTNNHGPSQSAEQVLVIPMSVMGYLTNSSGFLTIASTEYAKVQMFDASLFSSPPPDWVPPYPYCPGDVLFAKENPIAENAPDQVSAMLNSSEKLFTAQLLANDSLGG